MITLAKNKKAMIQTTTGLLVLLVSSGALAAENFKMRAAATKTTNVSRTFIVTDQKIDLQNVAPLDGIAITGTVALANERGLVRVVLVDDKGAEHLVYESHGLLADASTYSVKNVCEETCLLDGVVGKSLRFEIEHATFTLDRVSLRARLWQARLC